ncbi:MAG: hypothetical protein WAU58_09800 [Terriglobales bacterium]
MRKCLGVLAVVASLCAIVWAQAPDQAPPSDAAQAPAATAPAPPADTTPAPAANAPQTPAPDQTASEPSSIPTPAKPAAPKYPLTELFVGYSFAQAGFFNAGHWAQLNGWNASFGLNVTSLVGLVVDGGQLFGQTQIPGAVPAPFPVSLAPYCTTGPACTFNADTREYNILFGAQFHYRKHERWVPFGEVLVGHDGIRGIAQTQSSGALVAEVSSGIAIVAGAGADHKINDRFALRIKADYLQTRTSFATIGKAKQDNLRLSVGLVIRSVKKKKRRLEDETELEP